MKTTKERKREKRFKIEKSIEELQNQLTDKVKLLKSENILLKEKIKKYEEKVLIKNDSPEGKKLSPTEKLLIGSGKKEFLEDSLGKKEQKKEISNFNDLPKKTEIINPILPIEEKPKNQLRDRIIDIYTSDYYSGLSDNEIDKTEIAFLDNLIKNKEIFIRLEYLANVKYITKIEFLKPEPKVTTINTNTGIPTAPKLNIPIAPKLNIPTPPNLLLNQPLLNQGNIPKAPPMLSGLLGKPKTTVELDNKLEDIEPIILTKDDISVGDETLYFGKLLFAKLFQNYLFEGGIKQIPVSVKLALNNERNTLLKLKDTYFIDNNFSFENLDRYLLLGYNAGNFEPQIIGSTINFPKFNEVPYSFSTNNENNLKDYLNFLSIKFDYKKYIEYAINQIIQEIKKQLHQYHSLEDVEKRFNYKYNTAYDIQKDVLFAQFNALQKDINVRTSNNRIEKILKTTPKAIKDLTKAVIEYKEPEKKKIEPKKQEATEKKKERIMLLQALGIDVKSKTSDSMFAMKYEMQIKRLLKETDAIAIVDCLMDMAKGGLKLKDEKHLKEKDQDIARILLDNLIKYSQ